jgi:hypothetical protein
MKNIIKLTGVILLAASLSSCAIGNPNYASTYGDPYFDNGVYYAPQNYYGNGGYYGDDGYYYRNDMRYYYDNGVPYYLGNNRNRVYLQQQNNQSPVRTNNGFRDSPGTTVNTPQPTRTRNSTGFRDGGTVRVRTNQPAAPVRRSGESGGFRNNNENRNTAPAVPRTAPQNTPNRSQGGFR